MQILKKYLKSFPYLVFLRLVSVLLNAITFFLAASFLNIDEFGEYAIEDVKDKNFFLKIDIEGSEYRFLDQQIMHQKK